MLPLVYVVQELLSMDQVNESIKYQVSEYTNEYPTFEKPVSRNWSVSHCKVFKD